MGRNVADFGNVLVTGQPYGVDTEDTEMAGWQAGRILCMGKHQNHRTTERPADQAARPPGRLLFVNANTTHRSDHPAARLPGCQARGTIRFPTRDTPRFQFMVQLQPQRRPKAKEMALGTSPTSHTPIWHDTRSSLTHDLFQGHLQAHPTSLPDEAPLH
ncbi:hypothetical protein DHEL01_v201094 [Diaporthe helianthi]|uniref:Uncharacterized protein n=1 Tax=Diaporthe helianthi TaxID=158607 RepID=A0A2P5IDE3_DIAHE|nr:hypothetical protein DHEL01_v201094 [Diaporthe helianthi]